MIETERDRGVLSVKVRGRIDGSNSNDFCGAVEAALADDDTAVIIDMEEILYISSAGLRVLLVLAKMLELRNTHFAVCSLSEQISEVFRITGFDKVIGVHQSSARAREALTG